MHLGWRWLAACVALLGTAALCDAAPGKPVVTNKLRFRIPFRFDAAALQRMNARELQMYVSINRGANWELSQAISPQAGKFEFQAPADGEYWFAVKTVDGSGLTYPAGETIEPGLVVVVDTLPPNLLLEVVQLSPGKVQLSWAASDPTLDPSTLRLEYQQPGSDWQQVGVLPKANGQTTWTLPQGGTVSVRGTISDGAGNSGQGQARAVITPTGNEQPLIPEIRQPIAGRDNTISEATPSTPNKKHAPRPASAPPLIDMSVPEPSPTAAMPVIRPGAPAPGRLVNDSPTTRPEIAQDRWPGNDVASITPPAAPVQDRAPIAESGNRQRLVSTRRFQLAYRVDEVGPSGVGGVELFITQDGGRKWWKYGEDADRTSPIEVEVPSDGDYGFAVRVRSGAGLVDDPPATGEPPAIVVGIDQTPPAIELFPVHQGQGAEMNQLLIRWRLTDAHLADKPVSLSYSVNQNGPWEPITSWRADSGSYQWTVSPSAPPQFYVRIQVRDAAGNTAQSVSPRPILVDLTRPTARIVDVEGVASPTP